MITFYPRDIGYWRETFDFSSENRPSKTFEDRQALYDYIFEHGVLSKEHTLQFIETANHSTKTTHVVHWWTIIGYMREE